ncbi:MAG: tetratricopeptide repeat protein [Mariprofundaceae bacterium]
MASKTPKRSKQRSEEIEVTVEEVKDLERDMRSAKLAAWIEENQRNLIYATVGVLVVIFGSVMWVERQQSYRETAATFYYQALQESDPEQKRVLLHQAVQDFHGTSYAPLSLMQLAALEPRQQTQHLEALLSHPKLTTELMHQASLDLAEAYIQKGETDKAESLLNKELGEDFEQVRHYLLAQLADNDAERTNQYQQALDAKSHDENLNATIQRLLAEL